MRLVVSFMTLLILSGCSDSLTITATPNSEVTTQEPVAVAETTEEKPVPSVPVIIDVRTQAEWDGGHLEQAIHIPHDKIAENIKAVTSDKDAKIVLYCRSGGRAGRAKQTLETLGYVNVENVGGFEDAQKQFGADKSE